MKTLILLLTLALFTTPLHAQSHKSMKQDAASIVKSMGIGWNLGNTLEAHNRGAQDSETSWGNPHTTKEMIDSIAAAGFGAVRIPVRWYPHFTYDGTFLTIDPAWIARVKEVVSYCLDNNLYAIINTHHESWLEGHPTYADSASVYKQFRLLWTEIATAFRDYDERLLFAGTNEVHVGNNWGRPTGENAEVQNGFNQVFVNAVRATGGKNKKRNLIVQTYVCNGQFGAELFKMPTDKAKHRLIVEMHNYDPYRYGLTDDIRFWGKDYAAYGTESPDDEAVLAQTYDHLRRTFTDRGIPFIIGEMGSNYHTFKDSAEQPIVESSCTHYYDFVLSTIRTSGAAPFIWDNGATTHRGRECFGLFDRRNHMRCMHPGVIETVRKASKSL